MSRIRTVLSNEMAQPKTYDGCLKSGFEEFLKSGDLSDITVISPAGESFPLHRLLLANKSQFFARMFASASEPATSEKKTKNVTITLQGHQVCDSSLLYVFVSVGLIGNALTADGWICLCVSLMFVCPAGSGST